LGLIERGVVKLETNAIFGPSVEVVVDGINTVIEFVVEFVIDTDANVDVMFKDLTLLAVVTSSIFIVSLCPSIFFKELEVVMFKTVTFNILFFTVVVTVVGLAVVVLFKYNFEIVSIGLTVN